MRKPVEADTREMQEWCQSRLSSIISDGLDPIPPCVFDLDVLLSVPVVDLAKITRVLSSDPELSRRVLYLSNKILGRSHDRAHAVSEAVILLGPCLFHTAVLLCAVTAFGDRAWRDENADAFWGHSVQVAMVSERIASQSGDSARGLAYMAGLLHDIGHLPLLIIAREMERAFRGMETIDWRDDVSLEREIFGLDHCQIGLWMAKSWKLSPILIDIISHHHDPGRAQRAPALAEIVCAAEYCCPERAAQSPTIRTHLVLSGRRHRSSASVA